MPARDSIRISSRSGSTSPASTSTSALWAAATTSAQRSTTRSNRWRALPAAISPSKARRFEGGRFEGEKASAGSPTLEHAHVGAVHVAAGGGEGAPTVSAVVGAHELFERSLRAELEDVGRRSLSPVASAREHATVGADRDLDAPA